MPPLIGRIYRITSSGLTRCKAVALKVLNILLWPLTLLERMCRKGNRLLIRWAMRHRSRPAYLFALYWSSVVSVGLVLWVAWTVPVKEQIGAGATFFFVIAVINKFGALLLYLLKKLETLEKYWKHYRRWSSYGIASQQQLRSTPHLEHGRPPSIQSVDGSTIRPEPHSTDV